MPLSYHKNVKSVGLSSKRRQSVVAPILVCWRVDGLRVTCFTFSLEGTSNEPNVKEQVSAASPFGVVDLVVDVCG